MRRPSIIILWSFIVTLVVWGALIAVTPEGPGARSPMMGHMGWDGGFPWLRARLKGPLDEAERIGAVVGEYLGGATGLAGIAAVIWCNLRGWPPPEQRAVFRWRSTGSSPAPRRWSSATALRCG